MASKNVLNFLLCFIIALILQSTKSQQVIKVENIFQQNVTVHPGDVLQCKIKQINAEEKTKDFHVYTAASGLPFFTDQYQFHPVTEKCFTFKVRAAKAAHIAISSIPSVSQIERIEVILEYAYPLTKFSTIRHTKLPRTYFLSEMTASGVINGMEYREFWIRMLDDRLLEVGRGSETTPFLHHMFAQKMEFNYVGFMTWGTKGAWIINGDQKCPGKNSIVETKKLKAESDCFILQ